MQAYTVPADSSIAPCAIIGSDNLTNISPSEGFPYSSVVALRVFYDTTGDNIADDEYIVTAYLVSNYVAITAAHGVVLDPDENITITQIRVHFDLNSSTLNSSYVVVDNIFWSQGYTAGWGASANEDVQQKYDYAVLTLQSPVSRPTYFNCLSSSSTFSSSISVSGYPEGRHHYQFTSHGTILDKDTYRALYDNDTLSGMSGAPIYGRYTYSCYGVHTGDVELALPDGSTPTYNIGVLFHSGFLTLIQNTISANQ